jgi:hypothetical protein
VSLKLIALLSIISIFLAIAQKRSWINLFNKNKPSMGSVMGVFDEMFNPSRHQAIIQLQEKKELKVEAGNTDLNTIHIELKQK